MHWTAPGRALIAWDSGQGPHFARGPGGADLKRKAFASFDVYRTADPTDLTGILIGTTRAEAFCDTDAPEGLMVWYRIVGRTKDGGTIPVGARVPVTIPTRAFASDDTTPPSPPDHFKARLRRTGKLLTWQASCDAESGLLAYMVYDADQDQPDSVVWAIDPAQATSHAVRRFLDRTTNKKKRYRLRAIDCALNLCPTGPVAGKSAEGWTVYTFLDSSRFEIVVKETLDADVLVVGGGGSGGGGIEGGGGGGGRMLDLHGQTIVAGEDGDVIVGEGGGWVDTIDAQANLRGNPGEDSSFGPWTAKGGGYGGSEGERSASHEWLTEGDYQPGYQPWYYNAGDGGSGGGGGPWDPEDEYPPYQPDPAWQTPGRPGQAIDPDYSFDTYIPYDPEHPPEGAVGQWEDMETGLTYWCVTKQGGHDGGPGAVGDNSFCGGGGGGAFADGGHQPYYWYNQYDEVSSWNPVCGGHGVACNIRGWHGYEESFKTVLFSDWFAGGGQGVWRNMGWPRIGGAPGYAVLWHGLVSSGEGGTPGSPGAMNTGQGGGGAGKNGGAWVYPPYTGPDEWWMDPEVPRTWVNAPVGADGPPGARGIVVIRIRTADEDLVTYPMITGTDPDPEHNEFGLPVCLCDDPHVRIRRLPGYMTHDDAPGDEQGPSTYEDRH